MVNDDEPVNTAIEVFVISPIGRAGSPEHDRAKKVLKHIIRKALPDPRYAVRRADEESHPDSITPRITRRIVEAGLVVVDLTGHNPNVMYEVAIAHSFGKPVVHIISDGELPPFDIKDMRTISYDICDLDSVEQAIANVSSAAITALNSPDELVTPVTALGRFADLSRSVGTDKEGSAIAAAMEELIGRMSHIERSLRRLGGSPALNTYAQSRAYTTSATYRKLVAQLHQVLRALEPGDTSAVSQDEVMALLQRSLQALPGTPDSHKPELERLIFSVERAYGKSLPIELETDYLPLDPTD